MSPLKNCFAPRCGFGLILFGILTSSKPAFGTELPSNAYLCRIALALLAGDRPIVVGTDVRQDLDTTRTLAMPLHEVQAEAWRRFPNSPRERAQYIASQLPSTAQVRWDAAIQIDSQGRPVFRNTTFSELSVQTHTGLNTLIVRSRNLTPDTADAIIVGLHGAAASYSHSGTMLNLINLFGSQRSSGMRGQLNEQLLRNGITVPGNSGTARIPRVYER